MGSLTMDRTLLAQLLLSSLLLNLAAAQSSALRGLSSFGSFGGFGRSTSGWSSWSRSELRSGTIRGLAPLSRSRAPSIDEALGLRKSAFDSFESAWLKGGRETDDGYWYTGAQRKRVKNTEEEEEEEEDYYDDISEYDGIMEMKEKDLQRVEQDLGRADRQQEGRSHSTGRSVPRPGGGGGPGGEEGAQEGWQEGQGHQEGCRPEA